VLLSDPSVIRIIELMAKLYKDEKKISPSEILERLEGEDAKGLFREAMLKPSLCRDNELEQAINEFEDRVQKIRISKSKEKALQEGDMERLNKIPKLQKERWG